MFVTLSSRASTRGVERRMRGEDRRGDEDTSEEDEWSAVE